MVNDRESNGEKPWVNVAVEVLPAPRGVPQHIAGYFRIASVELCPPCAEAIGYTYDAAKPLEYQTPLMGLIRQLREQGPTQGDDE